MDNLYPVAFGEGRARPIGAADDGVVVLYGETFGREAKVLDERFEVQSLRHVALFSVDFDTQSFSSLDSLSALKFSSSLTTLILMKPDDLRALRRAGRFSSSLRA